MSDFSRGERRYLLVVAALAVAYLAVVVPLWLVRPVDPNGPLRLHAPDLSSSLPGSSLSPVQAAEACYAALTDGGERELPAPYQVKVVGGMVEGRPYFGCYSLDRSTGRVWSAAVVDGSGVRVRDPGLLQWSGAWEWVGLVKTRGEVALGLAGLAAIAGTFFVYWRRPRPGPPLEGPWWARRPGDVLLGVTTPVIVGAVLLTWLPGRSRARKARVALQTVIGFGAFFLFVAFVWWREAPDVLGGAVLSLLAAVVTVGWLCGRAWLRPAEWGLPDVPPSVPSWDLGLLDVWRRRRHLPTETAGRSTPPPAEADSDEHGSPGWSAHRGGADPARTSPPTPRPAGTTPSPAGGPRSAPPPPPTPTPTPRSPQPAAPPTLSPATPGGEGPVLRVLPPSELPTFADVGGMQALKEELTNTVGLLLAYAGEADALKIDFNGILLHGPPGVGKTHVARATAGEFGLNLLAISVADVASRWAGEAARNLATCFSTAAANIPALLFFDEFDAVASRREDSASEETRRAVNQLLQSLEAYRRVRALIVMAATNHLEELDPAVIRPGRFDRRIRVDLPDRGARQAILAAELAGRAVAEDIDLDDLADRTEGLTPAALAEVVDTAALAALRDTAAGGRLQPLTHAHLRGALAARGGRDRPTVEGHGFERLVLDPKTVAELRQIRLLLTDPDTATAYGIEPPSGVLLAGPPGTGKTTIARALAAEAGYSFYPTTVADLTSKWVGEGEEQIRRLFARARDNAPSIVFIDEIDGLAARRAGGGIDDRLVSQLLAEIDGLGTSGRVFVLAATNRPEQLDPALTRGGRLSRTIWVGLPDHNARRALLGLFTRPMPLAGAVNLDALADETDGMSGADLEALCQQAAVEAMVRTSADADATAAPTPQVTGADFRVAVEALRASRAATGTHGPSSKELWEALLRRPTGEA
ncbi:MAG: AAA family ATPase [Nitriliruptorales bacterium]